MGIPEESADKGEQEHGGEVDADGGAEEDQGDDQYASAVQTADGGQELLHHARGKGQENDTDGEPDHGFVELAHHLIRRSQKRTPLHRLIIQHP